MSPIPAAFRTGREVIKTCVFAVSAEHDLKQFLVYLWAWGGGVGAVSPASRFANRLEVVNKVDQPAVVVPDLAAILSDMVFGGLNICFTHIRVVKYALTQIDGMFSDSIKVLHQIKLQFSQYPSGMLEHFQIVQFLSLVVFVFDVFKKFYFSGLLDIAVLFPDLVVQAVQILKFRRQRGIQEVILQDFGHIGVEFVRIANDAALMLTQPGIEKLESFGMGLGVCDNFVSFVFNSTAVFPFDDIVENQSHEVSVFD